MNDRHLNNKLRHDVAALEKDISTLEGDRVARLGRFEVNVRQARADLTNWAGDGISQISEELDKLADDAKTIALDLSSTVKKDVEEGLNQYNLHAQAAADRVPGGFAKQAARYPWVAMTVALAAGLMLGGLFNLRRKHLDPIQT